MISEAQRRAVYADILDPIWGSAPDHQIADAHGVTPGDVRDLRAEHRRNLGITELAGRLEELNELIAWPGSPGELLAACVEAALRRAQARQHREGYGSPMARHRAAQEAQRSAAMESATLGTERPAAAPCEPTKATDCGRSADRVRSRSQARAEASEGTSGRKGPEVTATARSRGVPGAQAAGVAGSARPRQRVPAASGGVGLR